MAIGDEESVSDSSEVEADEDAEEVQVEEEDGSDREGPCSEVEQSLSEDDWNEPGLLRDEDDADDVDEGGGGGGGRGRGHVRSRDDGPLEENRAYRKLLGLERLQGVLKDTNHAPQLYPHLEQPELRKADCIHIMHEFDDALLEHSSFTYSLHIMLGIIKSQH